MVEINIVVGEEICKVIVAPVVMHISYHNRFDGVSCGLVSHISVVRTAIFMQIQTKVEDGIYSRERSEKLISDGKRKFDHTVHTLLRMPAGRSEEHTSELQSRGHLVCRLLLEKKKTKQIQ